jgi:hypothetical protein
MAKYDTKFTPFHVFSKPQYLDLIKATKVGRQNPQNPAFNWLESPISISIKTIPFLGNGQDSNLHL